MIYRLILACVIVVLVAFLMPKYPTVNTDEIFENVSNISSITFETTIEERNGWLNLSELEKNSDLIVEVEPISRAQYDKNIITKCKLINIFKGTEQDDVICIAETANISIDKKDFSLNIEGFLIPMKNENRYVCFLKRKNEFKNYYYFTSILNGQYNLKNELSIYEYDSNDDEDIDIQEIDIVVEKNTNYNLIDEYVKMHNIIINNWLLER